MQPRRLAESISVLVLFPLMLASASTAGADEKSRGSDSYDVNPNELNVNVDEPQIDIPEVHQKRNPFRNVSQGVRQPSQDPLIQMCQEAVDTTTRRLLSTDQHTPWQMIHALLGLRHDFMLQHEKQVVSGLEWIAQGQVFENEYWFEKTPFGGRAHPYSRPYAFEGHANQTVAILSMCGVDLDMEFGTADGTVTMRQMIEHAKMSLDVEKDEPTWTLWALSRYLPPDARWRTAKGEIWSIEKLVQEQTARPLKGAACGGTHGLFALAHARNVYLRQGKPLRGVWQQAEFKIRKYIQTARMQQNSNGTLSSNYFRGRQYNPDFNKRMASAGHILEFLMIALPQEELKALWVRRAIEATAKDLMDNRKAYVKCSPLYHSVNALNIYLDRVNPRSAPSIASGDESRQTAMAVPRRLQDPSGQLRKVPAQGISESRGLNETSGAETQQSDAASQKEADDAESNSSRENQPVQNKQIQKEEATWTATPQERRTEIKIPAEQHAESQPSTSEPPEPSPPSAEQTPNIPLSIPAADDTATTESPDQTQAAATEQTVVTNVESSTSTVPEMSESDADVVPVTEPARQTPAVDAADMAQETSASPSSTMTSVSSSRTVSVPDTDDAAVPKSLASETDAAATPDIVPSRGHELVSARHTITDAVDLQPGQRVAVLGGASGLFLQSFSEDVTNTGKVFVIDPAAAFVNALEQQVTLQELQNVVVVRNDDRSLLLGQNRLDAVILCDAYGHFGHAPQMLASIFRTLEVGGELLLIDPIESADDNAGSTDAEASQKANLQSAFEAAGFRYVDEVAVTGLQQFCFLRFRRPTP